MTSSADILERIVQRKHEEVAASQRQTPLDELRSQTQNTPSPRGFYQAIRRTVDAGRPAVIAEIKKASPSKGVIRVDFDPVQIAKSYSAAGASCLSVLTDRDFFQGNDAYIEHVKGACDLPVLRKDFMVDPWQIYQSRVIDADCILLIVAILSDEQLQEYSGIAMELGMDVLVEVHDREELERGLMLRLPLIGINNRDLHTFKTDINTTIGLLTDVMSDRTVVTESGIHSKTHIAMMRKQGVNAFLIGEAFMTSPDPGKKLRELFGPDTHSNPQS